MKKLGFIVMPLMAISFLASFGCSAKTYHVTFKKEGTDDVVKTITISDSAASAPTFVAPDYYTGKWVSTNPAKELTSGETFNFTGNDLHDWTFNYQETETNYTITFKKDGEQDVTKTVNLTNPSFTTPKFKNVPYYTGSWVCDPWVGEYTTCSLGSETSYTLDKDEGELTDHTFIYTNKADEYNVVFGSGDDYKGTEKISIEDLTITAPTHDISKHYDSGAWKEGEIEIESGDEYTFTKNQLGNHTFTWTQTPHQYTLTFEYADGQTERVEKNISIEDLTITAPTTTMTPTLGRAAWKTSDGLIIDSNESRTFDKSELNDYVFTETDVEGYSITYILGDEAAVNPEANPKIYKSDETVTLSAPTLDGFTFKGWYLSDNEHDKFQYQTGWSAGQMTKNLTLYADWHITDKTLDDYSWSDISDISTRGEASKYFDIADTKNLNVDGNDNQVRIIDYNYDKLSTLSNNETKYAGITFEFVNTISGFTTPWNDKDGTSSDALDFINKSNLNECLQPDGEVYEKLNDVEGLMDVIKEVIKSVETGTSFKMTDYETKLFPLSGYENNNLTTVYEYYKTDTKNRCKKDAAYWLREPMGKLDTKSAIYIDDNGDVGIVSVNTAYAVAPAFCI